jgi:hypothetical protein
MSPSPRLAALLAVLVALLIPAVAHAVPDPGLVVKDAQLIDDGLAAWSQKSGPNDGQYFADGEWRSGSANWFSYTQSGPASAAALLWRYGGMARTDLYTLAVSAIDHAIATRQRSDGAFVGSSTDSQPAGIQNNMYARELGIAYLALEPGLDAAHKASWKTAIARAADYLINTGELNWYTNGNIELGEIELFYLAARITGEPRFSAAYETDWAFALAPPQQRWKGFGLQQTATPSLASGADGRGYLAEAGYSPGFDAEYTGVQLDVATRLYVLSGDPRALKLANLEVNQLLSRVDATWQLDTSDGTRHPQVGRKVPFQAQTMAILAGAGRPDLAEDARAQWPYLEAFYRDTYRYTSVTYYKNIGTQLGTTLLAAMTAAGSLADWTPPVIAATTPAPATTTVTTPAPAAPKTTAAPVVATPKIVAAKPAARAAPGVSTSTSAKASTPAKAATPTMGTTKKTAKKAVKKSAKIKTTKKRAKAKKKVIKATRKRTIAKRRSTKA